MHVLLCHSSRLVVCGQNKVRVQAALLMGGLPGTERQLMLRWPAFRKSVTQLLQSFDTVAVQRFLHQVIYRDRIEGQAEIKHCFVNGSAMVLCGGGEEGASEAQARTHQWRPRNKLCHAKNSIHSNYRIQRLNGINKK